MKKLIVLSAVLFATLNLTSCKKAETAPEAETEVIETTVDTVAAPVVDTVAAPAQDTVTVKEVK